MKLSTFILSAAICFAFTACSDNDNDANPIKEEAKDVQAVDLGLSVKWADRNVGAATPEGYGGLFGWADPTGTKTSTNIKDYPGDSTIVNISGTEYDIAHMRWGGTWRLPTHQEQVELYDNCTRTLATVNGMKGMQFTSKKNGKSIFLPFVGDRWGSKTLHSNWGDYWSGTRNDSLNYVAYHIYISYNGNSSALSNGDLYMGYSVRPVMP